MPFTRVKQEPPKRDFQEIDKIVINQVFPYLDWSSYGNGQQIPICPNYRYNCMGEQGPTHTNDPRKFFALGCRKKGLSYAEIGSWLDACLQRFKGCHSDGLERKITAQSETVLRIDRRKIAYSFNGVFKRSLEVYLI